MFGTCLEPPFTLRQSCSGELGLHLDAFAASVGEAGYSPHTVRTFVRASTHFCLWAERLGLVVASFDERTLRRFKRHLSQCKCPSRRKGLSRSAFRGAELFLAHLRGCGVIAPAHPDPAPRFGEASERFRLWMARHRGVAAATLHGYQRYLRPFLAALGEDAATYEPARIS